MFCRMAQNLCVLIKRQLVPGVPLSLLGMRSIPTAHGHVLRVLVVRWIALPPGGGQHFSPAFQQKVVSRIVSDAESQQSTNG